MKFYWKACSVLVLSIAISITAYAQTSNPWSPVDEAVIQSRESIDRKITPQKYQTLALNTVAMRSILAQAPHWHNAAAEHGGVELALPMPDGSFSRFKVVEAPVMHSDLQKKYPEIRTYAGVGIDDPAAYFRGDFTLRGFHGMIRSPHHSTVFIDPYAFGDIEHYQVYYRKDFTKADAWACHFDEVNNKEKEARPAATYNRPVVAGDCVKRTYTLALACTGEYATFHGGTVALVLSAFNTTMARVNGVFEQDISATMVLHPNTNSLIFLNASTDPYTNGSGNAMLTENQTTCDNIIGNANYDIGHVFSTGGGGVAYLGSLCNATTKAGGVTGRPNPIGDPFDIDYVAHEMGHQFAANHTQNNACQRNGATSMEPGSASTIMGYAGICAPNVQNNSDDYFHAISIQEMSAEITSGVNGANGNGGNTCSTNSVINNPPSANAGPDYTIPRSTPFILTGVGSDPNGDPITFTWEQMDPAVATMPPAATNTGGPAFRSFKGTTNPSRYLPRLIDVVNNVTPTWEVLPSVGRTLNFRLTVRDNKVGGGCTAEDNMVVTVNGASGPFVVTAPNTAVSWPGNSTQTVTWDVANTNVAPVSCANVDILMSTDGGLTYPITLATATPNDGSHSVIIPIGQTTTARIMVRGNGNIFYDISNVNFSVTAPLDGFSISSTPTNQGVCVPNDAVYNLALTQLGSFTGTVNLSITGLPPGATAQFSPPSVTIPGNSTLTIFTNGATVGSYSPVVTGTSGSNTSTVSLGLLVSALISNSPSLTSPVQGATSQPLLPTLTWSALAGSAGYDLQVSTSSTFGTTVVNQTGLTTTSYTLLTALTSGTTYYWRVRATNSCSTGPWSPENQFTTACTQTINSTNVPVTIPSSGTPTVTSTLSTSGISGSIVAVIVKDLKIHHTWVGDLRATLTAPNGSVYTLFDRPGVPATSSGCPNNHILATFDQSASQTAANFENTCNTSTATTPPPYAITGTYQPVTSLAGLAGTTANGTWTLTVQDLANNDGGSIQSWGIQLITECNSVLTLTQTFISGYMDGSTMRPVLQNSGVAGATSAQADTITVALHAATSPYAQVYSQKVVLGITGAATVSFPSGAIGNSYYIVIKGRNLLETWSATPQTFGVATAYNFGVAANAYGGNMATVGGIPVLYNGDIDALKDGHIDLLDYPVWENDYNNTPNGYIRSDLNGDGLINQLDYSIWESRYNNFISVKKP